MSNPAEGVNNPTPSEKAKKPNPQYFCLTSELLKSGCSIGDSDECNLYLKTNQNNQGEIAIIQQDQKGVYIQIMNSKSLKILIYRQNKRMNSYPWNKKIYLQNNDNIQIGDQKYVYVNEGINTTISLMHESLVANR